MSEHFSKAACDRYRLPEKGFSKQFTTILGAYSWPGNVRELGNVIEAAVIAAGKDPTIYPKHLPGHIRVSHLAQGKPKPKPAKQAARTVTDGPIHSYKDYKAMRDQAYFQQLMDICDYEITEASRLSGLSVPSIYRHLSLAGIQTRSPRRR